MAVKVYEKEFFFNPLQKVHEVNFKTKKPESGIFSISGFASYLNVFGKETMIEPRFLIPSDNYIF
jgi:hypothetical protein